MTTFSKTFGAVMRGGGNAPACPRGDTVDLAKSIAPGRVIKFDADQRLVTGIVLQPCSQTFCEVDAQNDVIAPDELERIAHEFLERIAKGAAFVGAHHTGPVAANVVESYLAPCDFIAGEPPQSIVKGTWVMTVRVHDDAVWDAVKSGELNAFSIGGRAERVPA